MSIYLSKSDFKVARTCATKLYYKKLGYPSIRDDDEYLQFLADGGYMIETIAKLCHPDGIEIGFDQGPEASAEETMRALQAHTVTLFEATLIAKGRLARVDILKKIGNVFELIEVKAKSVDSSKGDNLFRGKREGIKPKWRPYLEDVAFQVVVLRDVFPAAEIVPYLCLTDRSKTTSIDQIFSKFQLVRRELDDSKFQRPTVSYTGDPDELRKEPFLTVINIADEVRELLPEVEKSSAVFEESLQTGVVKIPVAINVDCRSCEYRFVTGGSTGQVEPTKNGFKECWGSLADENPHILDYYHLGSIGSRNHRRADTLISRGRTRMADIEEADLVKVDGTPGPINFRQRIQREYTLANREYFAPDLRRRIEALPYPLHFIDFETSRVAVPYHAGMHPYEQVAFQWSCHTIRENGANLEHAEWINVVDAFPNFQFAESLMDQIRTEGSFLIWSNHENAVLNDIRRQMHDYRYQNPQLEEWLNTVPKFEGNDSKLMVDMCEMAKACYFHPKMKGRLSLKYVLPAVWETNRAIRNNPAFAKYHRLNAKGRTVDPYDTLPALPFGNPEDDEEEEQVVTEGTGAMKAYQEMLYGLHRNDEATKEQWRRLLLQYCELDTAAMVMVWTHWIENSPLG